MTKKTIIWLVWILIINCLITACQTKDFQKKPGYKLKFKEIINDYPNFEIEEVKTNGNKLSVFISDSLDVNNAPFTNEFVFHFYYRIKKELSNFDSVSVDIRIVEREDKYREERFFASTKQILEVIEKREKNHEYLKALDWILKNDYRVTMEVANVSYASVMGIKDIWSIDNNIFGLIQLHYSNCKHRQIPEIVKKIKSNFQPETNRYHKQAEEICSKIFSNCKWIE